MTDKQRFILAHDLARAKAIEAVKQAPMGFHVEIKPRTRSLDQNALLHALFSDLARQAKLYGRALTATQWKTVMISAHAVATGVGADMIAGIEGEAVNIRESSAHMSVARMTSLIEYILAYCSEHGIKTSDTASQGWEEIRGAA